jgi:DNA-binding CsgD family transcriptional regulator
MGCKPARPGQSLTPREREVAVLIAQGLTNDEISTALDISSHTAKFHVERAIKKLGGRSRAHAAAIWARRELTFEDLMNVSAAGPSGDSRTLPA